MKLRVFLLLIVIAGIAKQSFGQNKHISEEYLKMPEHLKRSKGDSSVYESGDANIITSLQLKSDGSFIYTNLSTDGKSLSAGKYSLNDEILILEWDSIDTYKAIE